MTTITKLPGVEVEYERGLIFVHVDRAANDREWNDGLMAHHLHRWHDWIDNSPCNETQKAYLRAQYERIEAAIDREHERISRPPVAAYVVHYAPRWLVWGVFGFLVVVLWTLAMVGGVSVFSWTVGR